MTAVPILKKQQRFLNKKPWTSLKPPIPLTTQQNKITQHAQQHSTLKSTARSSPHCANAHTVLTLTLCQGHTVRAGFFFRREAPAASEASPPLWGPSRVVTPMGPE